MGRFLVEKDVELGDFQWVAVKVKVKEPHISYHPDFSIEKLH
jgi:hypothetical protein